MANNQIATAKNNEVMAAQIPNSQHFANRVLKEFGDTSGQVQATPAQRRLIQGYFIGIDQALKTAEEYREKKNKNNYDHSYDELLPYTWENVDISPKMAQNLMHYAKLGLDMTLPNQLSPVFFKDNKKGKYVCAFIPGYEGRRIVAQKYALLPFLNVIAELVYSTDEFIPHKKDKNTPFDCYEFNIKNPFNRGEVVGAFGYVVREDERQNELFFLTKDQIDKRKPEKASANFWGGESTVWENKKKVTKVIDGWYEEMALKTMKNYVYKHITIDPQKVDDNYAGYLSAESDVNEARMTAEVEKNANSTVIDIEAETPMPQSAQPAETAQIPERTVTAQTQQPAPIKQHQLQPEAEFDMAEIAEAEKDKTPAEAMDPMF